jgi:hypothetical protein
MIMLRRSVTFETRTSIRNDKTVAVGRDLRMEGVGPDR